MSLHSFLADQHGYCTRCGGSKHAEQHHLAGLPAPQFGVTQ